MGQSWCMERSVAPHTASDQVSQRNGSPRDILPTKERSCTNLLALLLFFIFIIGLFAITGYCIYHGDIYRIVYGYDDCGNVCGRNNLVVTEKDSKGNCLLEDMTINKYLVVKLVSPSEIRRTCVENCQNIGLSYFFNRCLSNNEEKTSNSLLSKSGLSDFFEEVSEDIQLCWKDILYLCMIAFVFSVIILILFRFVVGLMVWLVLIGGALTAIIGTTFLWSFQVSLSSSEDLCAKVVRPHCAPILSKVMWAREKNNYYSLNEESRDMVGKSKMYSYLIYSITATVITLVVLLLIFVMRKRIQLVIQLFKEAGKAVASMPLILAEPIATFCVLALTVGLWIYLSLWIESAGFLKLESNQSVNYKKDITIKVARWYNLFAFFWFSQFIIGCQHMVIAGAIASWFFSRNKNSLGFVSMQSFYRLIRFHLGTVALGSFVIAIVQMLRFILTLVQRNLKGSTNRIAECILYCCQCCLYCLENILQYLSRNAYIETAIFGYGFCKAGQQAFRLLSNNALRVAAINSVGDFVLFLAKVFVVMMTTFIGMELIQKKEGIHHSWVPLVVAGLAAYLTAHCFMTVYEMAIDTIFICFCEDCEMNDGISKPYYMSRGLMEFVQNSKKALAYLENNNSNKQAWSGANTISDKID